MRVRRLIPFDARGTGDAWAPGVVRLENPAWGYVAAIAAVGIATLFALPLSVHLEVTNVLMIYLFGIVVTALLCARGPALLAAIGSVAAFDFLFVPPQFTFTVHDARYWMTFAAMLVVSVVINTLTDRVRRQAEAMRDAEQHARTQEMRRSLLVSMTRELAAPLRTIREAAAELTDQRGLADRISLQVDHIDRWAKELGEVGAIGAPSR